MLSDILYALAGGGLIGLAAGLFFLVNGRILGISGLASALLGRWPARWLENVLFFLGLLIGTALVARPGIALALGSPVRLAVAGILVGFGVRAANGCTSGHAVCGLARGSKRSLVATGTFIAVAMATVALAKVF
ncbi:YeeE/YedE family protein [Telmatospirillum sp.]|uniref:YeeE/YedE family protein n=1 Tax=Telmatospirillum sp. TaxID=2079197 RepID=UPI00283B0C02|nr:YeeE/YedE family protein [Telmatospirillum sp.]MDR3436877.1 YeeE/YedE family protein [Telmatospirillum sp.]